MKVSVTVNGNPVTADVPDRTLLVHFVREEAGLTASNVGCDTSSCGACTVLLDGQSVKSCTVLAAQADGRAVTTAEGLAGPDGELHPVQQAFIDADAMQCAYCTPGMVLGGVALLKSNPEPTEEQIIEYMNGHLCRCGVYQRIVEAVALAAKRMKAGAG